MAKKFNIIWGGTWNTPDLPHFEIPVNWKYEGGEEINMEELKNLKAEFKQYVEHTNGIINTMGKEIKSLQDIINIMGKGIKNSQDDIKGLKAQN